MKQQSLLSLWGAKPKARKATAGGKENARKQQRVAQQSTPAAAPAEPPRAPEPPARTSAGRSGAGRRAATASTTGDGANPGRAAAGAAPVEPPAGNQLQPSRHNHSNTRTMSGPRAPGASTGRAAPWRARPTSTRAEATRRRRATIVLPAHAAVAVRARAARPHRAQRGVHAVPRPRRRPRGRGAGAAAPRAAAARPRAGGAARRSPPRGHAGAGDAPTNGGDETRRRPPPPPQNVAVAPYLAPAGAVDVSGEDATTFADDRPADLRGSGPGRLVAAAGQGGPSRLRGRGRRRSRRSRRTGLGRRLRFVGTDKLSRQATTASCASGTALLLKTGR